MPAKQASATWEADVKATEWTPVLNPLPCPGDHLLLAFLLPLPPHPSWFLDLLLSRTPCSGHLCCLLHSGSTAIPPRSLPAVTAGSPGPQYKRSGSQLCHATLPISSYSWAMAWLNDTSVISHFLWSSMPTFSISGITIPIAGVVFLSLLLSSLKNIYIYLSGCSRSQLWHVGSSVTAREPLDEEGKFLTAACNLLTVVCGIQLLDQGPTCAPWIGNTES